jgi:hypothetical protein
MKRKIPETEEEVGESVWIMDSFEEADGLKNRAQ